MGPPAAARTTPGTGTPRSCSLCAPAILGHSQIAVTMNIYTHVSDERRREAMGHMDRLLRRRRPE
ncbi:hypothetical protein GCM10023329_11640 [Streptomyces sanyensis]|uniref:Integrase n=1 Tax=Streptomyces sanyensis TaxID=568869 RepID=A0ABP8ZX51_9ACTN